MTRYGRRRASGALAVAVAGLAGAPAASARSWAVAAPGGELRAEVTQAAPGAVLALTVRHGSELVLAPSPLGLETSAGDLTRGLRPTASSLQPVDERYRTVSGKRRRHVLQARQLSLRLDAGRAGALRLDVLAARDGFAYRYVLPGHGRVTVLRETGGLRLPSRTAPIAAPWVANYEALWGGRSERSGVGDRGELGFPALARTGRSGWVLLSEAGVSGRYAAAHLQRDAEDPQLYRIAFPRPTATSPVGPMDLATRPSVVSGRRPLETPWRVAIAGRLAAVVESDLVTDLAEPSRVPHPGWIRPGRAVWSWLSDHESPRRYARQRQYVAFAGAQGWPYAVVDAAPDPGGPSGYSPGWRIWERRLPALVAYGRRRGVRLVLWVHVDELRRSARRRALLERFGRLGIGGVKVDFFDSDTQATMRLRDAILRDAARARLVVDLHGATLPTGLERTWPNLLSTEAVRGAEYYELRQRFGTLVPAPEPRHQMLLPYTRNVVGAMDFTPVTFSAAAAPGRRTTDGAELASAVIQESGLQVLGDALESYRERPVALELLDGLPTVWDDTRLLAGAPGHSVVIARRAGRTWFIGGAVAGRARTLRVPLARLGRGRWMATRYTDGLGGLVARRLAGRATRTLSVPVRADGGFVLRVRFPTAASRP